MAQTSITLTASMRSNLSSLRSIQSQMDRTQERLSTGKKVNSAIDNASSYYQSRALTNRAADLDSLLDSMGQGIQTIQAANEGIEAITSYVEQLKSVANSAFSLDSTAETYKDELQAYQDQYNSILKEIGTLAKDSSYQGINLLKGSNLTVMFNETRTHSLEIKGHNVTEQMAAKGANAFSWENASSTLDVGNGTVDWVGTTTTTEVSTTTTEYTMSRLIKAGTGDGVAKVPANIKYYDEDGNQLTAGQAFADGEDYFTKETKKFTLTDTLTEGATYQDRNGISWKVDVGGVGTPKTTKRNETTSAASAIDQTLDGISDVTTYLRSYATELGNNFTIIETRQDFTEALVDVLETGSDNLVLADMNEESANYLALQTRQQLAVNSLSLASQSAQSVLSLF